MKKTNVLAALPVLGLALALGGCGDDDSDGGGAQSRSSGFITACYTVNQTVSFGLTSTGVPSGQVYANRSTVGPMTYNGQAVTGQTFYYPSGGQVTSQTNYFIVTSGGITMGNTVVVNVDGSTSVTPDGSFLPQNMSPGQTVNSTTDSNTFVGFETITLAGKTFYNTCHFKALSTINGEGNAGSMDVWVAPGYLTVKEVSSTGMTEQYSGDL